jgi:2-polyprenyl-3-methyl-5-hydroxy-6-metoxy-1,4-benzoquinol methylase
MTTQINSNSFYTKMVEEARETKDKVKASGRYSDQAVTEPAIWIDIQDKLLASGQTAKSTLLDIGCGYSNLATWFSDLAKKNGWTLTLLDVPSVIAAMKGELLPENSHHLEFCEGTFPGILKENRLPRSFDRILAYSVLHYVDDPSHFIDEACKLLAPHGRLLIGDIPNASKKGRFLSSNGGREFDAKYKGIPLIECPKYEDCRDYFNRNLGAGLHLNDDLLMGKVFALRQQGFEAYIAEQPDGLPFSHTREDLIVMRHG